jgi:tRNA(Ile)-lysidine synthase
MTNLDLKKNPSKYIKYNYPEKLTVSEKKSKEYSDFFKGVKRTLETELFVEEKSKLLLAVSGGVDSITLFDVFINLQDEFNFDLAVVHFNHKLRDNESERDQKFVEKICRANKVKLFKSFADVKQFASDKSLSLEEAARVKRYQFFEHICNKHKYDYLVTAHTKNDLAETFLLNLFRGSGLHGLTSIPIRRKVARNSFVVRPLIHFTKVQLIDYAKTRGLKWVEDKTNDDLIFTRNKVRNILIPEIEENYNPNFVNTIERTASIIKSTNQFVVDYTESNFKKIFISSVQNFVEINSQFLSSYAEIIQNELIRKTLSKFFSFQNAPYEMTERITGLTNKDVGTKVEITTGLIASKERGKIVIEKERAKHSQTVSETIIPEGIHELGAYKLKFSKCSPKDVKFEKNGKVEYFDTEYMPKSLQIRNWVQGDRLAPFGYDGTVKISDFLNSNKIDNRDKNKVLMLTDKEDVIWVIGLRISQKYAINKQSKQILKVEILKSPINA